MDTQPNNAVLKMAITGATEALKVIQTEGSFPPMVVYSAPSGYKVLPFLANNSDEAVATGRKMALELPPEARLCVLLYDLTLNFGGVRYDAVGVQAHERGEKNGYFFAQRYRGGGTKAPLEILDQGVLIIGPVAPLLPAPAK